MPVSGALISEHRRSTDEPWHLWLRRALAAIGIGLFVLVAIYAASRARMVYQLSSELLALRAEMVESQKEQQRQDRALAMRMDDLERTLFGEVIAKIEKNAKTAATVPAWSKNRDEELRRRLINIDLRLFQLEQDLKNGR